MLAALGLGSASAAPPQRNLSVELRVSDEQVDDRSSATVTVGSRGGRSGAEVVARAGSARRDAVQRVLVLNAGQATLHLSQGVPVDDTEVWWTPWGPGAVVRSRWLDLVDGLQVRPLWPGGTAPVTLEIGAQRSAAPGTGAALPAQWTLLTTVQAPLGEWVTVAEVRSREVDPVISGGFSAATSARQQRLQVRVRLA